jgi:hypothetical protein
MSDDRIAHGYGVAQRTVATAGPANHPSLAALLGLPPRTDAELELTRAILARLLTGDAAVYTAADGSRFLGLDYSTVDLTDAEAAYLEELGR